MRSAIAMLAVGTALTLAFAAPAQAQATGDRDRALVGCSVVKNKADRLACFEAVAREVPRSAPPAAAEAPQPAAAAPAPAAPVAAAQPSAPRAAATDFGSETVRAPVRERESRPERPDKITARVASVTPRAPGMWRVTLDNGATWDFAESVSDFRVPGAQDEVEIRRGALGSYLMRFDKQPAIRVARVQ